MSRQSTTLCGELDARSPVLARLISYPYSDDDYAKKMDELEALGVQSILVGDGRSVVNGISIAGKGCVGLVFKAKSARGLVALKSRRTDADRDSMEREASLLKIANSLGVGPQYIGHTENLMVMEYVGGQSIGDWIGAASALEFRGVASAVLDQCYTLDRAGVDHGELGRMGRHVIVRENGEPCIIDFESASTTRRTANVTSAAQSLFLHGAIAARSRKFYPGVDPSRAIALLKKYKSDRTRDSYDDLAECLGMAA